MVIPTAEELKNISLNAQDNMFCTQMNILTEALSAAAAKGKRYYEWYWDDMLPDIRTYLHRLGYEVEEMSRMEISYNISW